MGCCTNLAVKYKLDDHINQVVHYLTEERMPSRVHKSALKSKAGPQVSSYSSNTHIKVALRTCVSWRHSLKSTISYWLSMDCIMIQQLGLDGESLVGIGIIIVGKNKLKISKIRLDT